MYQFTLYSSPSPPPKRILFLLLCQEPGFHKVHGLIACGRASKIGSFDQKVKKCSDVGRAVKHELPYGSGPKADEAGESICMGAVRGRAAKGNFLSSPRCRVEAGRGRFFVLLPSLRY